MSVIYRVRPANPKTIEELTKPYLWFARPTTYKDTEDANISSFIKNNEPIAEALERLFIDKEKLSQNAALSGICCFTKGVPAAMAMRFFPGAAKGVVIEYYKKCLEKHFVDTKGIGDCFKNIKYTDNPTIFETSSGYHILWQKIGKAKFYKSVSGIFRDPKETDHFFVRMFTTIAKKYRGQREQRIILAGRNIPDKAAGLLGYEIEIPKEAIKCVHVQKNSDTEIVQQIKDLGFKVHYFQK